MNLQRRPRRGTIAVFSAVCMTALLGVVALSLDGGVLVDDRRQVQAATDAAALAAADSLFYLYPLEKGKDPSGLALAKAQTIAAANGYTHGTNATVTVNIPPKSGEAKG